jgi:ribosomal protein L21E
MKSAKVMLLLFALCFLVSCGSSPSTKTLSNLRNYNGTASVGDFLTITVDSTAKTIAYTNYTNGETGTVPYTVNADGSYTITDPDGNLLSAYEVPGFVMVVEAANAGPNKDTTALITAIESVPASINSLAGQNFNYTQFRTRDGGVEIGTVSIDGQGNIQASGYDPAGVMWQPQVYFHGGTIAAASVHEDSSGNFFTINQNDGGHSIVFGTQNGLWAGDTDTTGAMLGLPKASSKNFDPASAGTYNAIYFEKPSAQMVNNVEVGASVEGKATISVSSGGEVTIADSQNNTLGSGTLVAVADTPYLYDGTQNTLSDPCYGLFTIHTTTANSQQDVFVSFQGNAMIFSSFGTGLPIQNNGIYTYFYGVGLK